MKIIHTADWHIGKKLHNYNLYEDFDLFIDWLVQFIIKEEINVLLVCGDIFDLANPSAEARKQYYRALNRLRRTQCKLIITGGNHDSPSMLDAPAEILRELNVDIIGGLPSELDQCLIPLTNEMGENELIIAAVPYLRDSDLRSSDKDVIYDNRIEVIKKGIEQTFKSLMALSTRHYRDIPILGMGHLYAAGITSSESERDIQIGNQAACEADQLSQGFSYLALGHIHKPQRLNASVPSFYSGSPLPLSFSERKDEKRLLVLDTKKDFEPESVPIPCFRKLVRISGRLPEINEKLNALQPVGTLTNLIEVELKEENYDENMISQLDAIVTSFKKAQMTIVKHRVSFKNQLRATGNLFENHHHLEDLKPREVFSKLLEQHSYTPPMKEKLNLAFQELIEELKV